MDFDKLQASFDKLNENDQARALVGVEFLRQAKLMEFLGLGPAESRHEYAAAITLFDELGVEYGDSDGTRSED